MPPTRTWSPRPGERPAARRATADAPTFHGWRVVFTEPFLEQYGDLSARVRQLHGELDEADYSRHPKVKLFLALRHLIRETIPTNPQHADYRLKGSLAKFRRTKGRGLPRRYRLFWTFSEQARTIIVLYLNDDSTPRRAGDPRDPYVIFQSLVDAGKIGGDFEANFRQWGRARRG